MTDHRAPGKSVWFEGFRRAWKQLTIARGEAEARVIINCFQARLNPERQKQSYSAVNSSSDIDCGRHSHAPCTLFIERTVCLEQKDKLQKNKPSDSLVKLKLTYC